MFVKALIALAVAIPVSLLAGCVRESGGVWHVREAALPVGWPELTPVGEIEIRSYPVYRAATVTAERLSVREDGRAMAPMFRELFGHIKERDIAMTAPVDMRYGEGTTMTAMAFLYRRPDQGVAETDGAVVVEDIASQTFVSLGVRGDYTDARFQRAREKLEAWLDANPVWEVTGGARYLGYNGPFTPTFWRYGEVQLPVRAARE